MTTSLLLKHQLGREAVITLSQSLSAVIDHFPKEQFIADALYGLDELELKQRVQHLISVLAIYLPKDFTKSAKILLAVKQVWDNSNQTESWGSYTAWPLIDYVAEHGIEHPELALSVLKALTPLFTAEFAIRPFIELHFELTYQQLLLWSDDADEQVRRLSSEGIRPRLPWGRQLSQLRKDPTPIFSILARLKDDKSLYVRKSVANNLNDIAKDHPEQVIKLCQQWLTGATTERQWIIRRALRSLIKQGRKEAFVLLGYTDQPQVTVANFGLDKTTLVLGEALTIEVDLHSVANTEQSLVLDYKVYHVKANGSHAGKVFKWKNVLLSVDEQLTLKKSHSFKLINTRKYYAGEHIIELLINGEAIGQKSINLVI